MTAFDVHMQLWGIWLGSLAGPVRLGIGLFIILGTGVLLFSALAALGWAASFCWRRLRVWWWVRTSASIDGPVSERQRLGAVTSIASRRLQ